MRIGIIGEYEIDLINLLTYLNEHEFYYFLLDSVEKRKVYNTFILPFSELEKYKKEIDIFLNFSDNELKIEKTINKLTDLEKLSMVDRSKPWICRIEKIPSENVFYFPYVIEDSIKKSSLDPIIENKRRKIALLMCEKIGIEVVGVISRIYDYFDEIYVYGIREMNTINSKNIYFLRRKLEKGELIKLLKYADIVLDFSKKDFYYELLYAAFLEKPILTIKKFRNFPPLIIDEKIRERIIKMLEKNKRMKYEITDNLKKNAEKIFVSELERLENFLDRKNEQ